MPEDRKHQGSSARRAAGTTRRSRSCSRLRAGVDPAAEGIERVSTSCTVSMSRRPSRPVATLSGGNQQKVVLARWLAAEATILILDEPTRGVDVGAKAEIHALIGELARRGAAVLLISSELPEVLRLADRILVLREGRMVGEVQRANASQESLLRLMAGLSPGEGTGANEAVQSPRDDSLAVLFGVTWQIIAVSWRHCFESAVAS